MIIRGGCVILDGRVSEQLWRLLRRAVVDAQQRDGGGGIRPEVAEAIDNMRLAASEYLTHQEAMSAIGRDRRTSADITPLLLRADHDDLTASDLAGLLHCSARHARRLAADAGIEPRAVRPYRWAKADVAVLLEHRRPA